MASTGASAFAPSVGNYGGIELSRVYSSRQMRSSGQTYAHESTESYDNESQKSATRSDVSKAEEWAMYSDVRTWNEQNESDQVRPRKLGVTWAGLSVYGVGADIATHPNVFSQFDLLGQMKMAKAIGKGQKTIIDNSHGHVAPGEMLLVLGRPGSGCTSLLSVLANHREGYNKIDGDVRFGTMTSDEALKFKGQIVMNTEEEIFFPTLTVGQTMDFATRLKNPSHVQSSAASAEDYRKGSREFLLQAMGITHTAGTKVGNEFVRGVSGGERKRVSIIETLATRASVFCWDNSTRGLDASTALDYAKALRAMTDILGLSTIVTLYQAGNGIYNQFDKVLVLDEGKQIFYGPTKEARPFMEELGFIHPDGGNTGDFLTSVTVPTERKIRENKMSSCPKNAVDIRAAYEHTSTFAQMQHELTYPDSAEASQNTQLFRESVGQEKKNQKSPFTVGVLDQVRANVFRQYQIIWGDKATFLIKQGSTLAQALIAGSLFYNAPNNSSGLFVKSGALFFALLYNALMAMSEVTDSFTGRPILAKHKAFAYHHPAAWCFAQICADIPILLFQVTIFSIVLYFMVHLTYTAAAFFTFWIVVFATTICMTACFRAVGAAFPNFDAASKVSGFLVAALVTYIGYMIPKGQMHPWFVWIYWIDPMAYAFESLMANEYKGKIIPCVNNNLVPVGPTYTDSTYRACTGVGGALVGATSVTGEQYLASLSYKTDHLWRNFGIVWVWWVLFVAITVFFTSRWKSSAENGRSLLVPVELVGKNQKLLADDEEAQVSGQTDTKTSKTTSSDDEPSLVRNTSVFTWQNLTYTVQTPTGPRVLLDRVQGYVKPGMLGALMGSSGAGKTTLLDVLAQRKTDGEIKGSVLVDGRELPVSFQRSAGYVEQLDIHEPLATVREALEFSALLRQSRETPREEKLKYVNTIIDLLEMHDIEHSLIGRVGAGLSVEQRKRLTIGVELVSKPSILIFLDEPTSGLDGQSSFNVVRFLRKLADAGQAVLCTIHQPSAALFAQFDTLLLLAKGGKTVYFGDIGENANTIRGYFAHYNAPCPPETNPAEHMIDVVSGALSKDRDWNQVWLESKECQKLVIDLERINSEAANSPPGTVDDGHEFAMPLWEQTKLVTHRMNVALYRNADYANNKVALHVGSALFNGFTFWMIGDSVGELQLTLFTIFNFIFVAPGVMAQLQPLFIDRRNIYEAREKKSKMYHWSAFVTGNIVSEIPYLMVCGVLYFASWYYVAGLQKNSNRSGATLFVMLIYELIYTGIGQFVAAYAPNAVFASLVNPLVIGILISFCGVLVPYAQIQGFWRYWLYYLNPFNYLMGSMLTFALWDKEVTCDVSELARFDPPTGQTCAAYLADYLAGAGRGTNLLNPTATRDCQVCEYRTGTDYLAGINLTHYYDGWRDAAICVIFAFSGYALVYLLMKLRTKATKKAV